MSKIREKTVEELLEEALVSEDEQPYSAPDNWVWIKLGDLCDIKTGKLDVNAAVVNGKYPFFTCARKPYNIDKYAFDSEAILIAGNGDFNVKYFNGKFNAYQRTYVLHKFRCNVKYVYYFVVLTLDVLTKNNRGSTIKYIRLGDLTNYLIALPPINEQKRIVDKLEMLLEKINQANQLIKEAKESFELRRAVILDKAFRGELTAKWREEKELESSSSKVIDSRTRIGWKITKFGDLAAQEKYSVAIGPFGSNLKVTDYSLDGIPLIFVRNIRSSDYSLDCKYVSEEKAKELKAHKVEKGDVLITKMGDPPGDSDLCPQYIDQAIITADCIKLRVNSNLANNKFIMYAIRSNFVQKQIKIASKGVAQQKISLKLFKEMNVELPPIKEQFEIVKIIEKSLEHEKEAMNCINGAEDRLKTLEQAILSKAFHGELGTNDPNEKSAMKFVVGDHH